MSSSNKNKKVSDTSSSSLPPGRGRGRSTALNPLTDHEGLANALKNLQALRRHRPDGTNHILSPTARNHVEILQGFRDNLRSLAREPLDVLVMETLPLNVRKRVEVLKQIQRRHDELEARFVEERAALEAKYQKHYEPLYTKRNGIVNGIVEVASSESALDQEEDKATEEKGVPNFWLTAMKNNEILLKEISEHDEDALKYLKDIKWCRTDEPKGFKLDFFFDANPYFKDTILTKTYQMIDEVEPILQEAIGMKIEWFPGKSLTQKVLKTKPKKGRRIIVKTEDCESFFNFFSPPQDQTAKDSLTKLEHDYNIGTTIRDKLIPHAVSWFVEKAIKEDVVENIDGDDDDKCEN